MRLPRLGLALVGACTLGGVPLHGEDLPGEWSEPPANGGSVFHRKTELAFPPTLVGYDLVGIFDFYDEEGIFVRYVSHEERARSDVFLFPLKSKPKELVEKQRAILSEIDAVVLRLRDMEKEGVYKDIEVADLKVGEIELWEEENLPLGSKEISATRIGERGAGAVEAKLEQWVGATVYRDHVITIRHQRPESTGEAGTKLMETYLEAVIELIKEPSLKAEVVDRLAKYEQDPLGPSALEHTAVVLAYLNQSHVIPTLVPAPPLTTWLASCDEVEEGIGEKLEQAFVMGHTAFLLSSPSASMDERLEASCSQLSRVYELLKQRYPDIQQPQLEELQAAAAAGTAAAFIKERT